VSGSALPSRCPACGNDRPLGVRRQDHWAARENTLPHLAAATRAMQRSRVAGLTLYDFAEGTPLLPDGHLRHQVRAWLNFEQTWVDGIISRARFRRTFPDVVPTHPMLFDIWNEEGQRALQTLDAHLASREFMVSDRFTIADIGLYAYVHVAGEGGFELSRYPGIGRWLQRVSREQGVLPFGTDPEAEGARSERPD